MDAITAHPQEFTTRTASVSVQISVKDVFRTGHGALLPIANAPAKRDFANSLRPGAGRNVHAKVSSSKKKFKLPPNTHDSIPLSTSIISCENKKIRHYYFMK